jgi:hypothetical protein
MSRGGAARVQGRARLADAAALCVLVLFTLVAAHSTALATRAWMSEEAIRAELLGKPIDGHFRNGRTWTVILSDDGRVEQLERLGQKMLGYWFFRGSVLCSVPDAVHRPPFVVSCWSITKTSANCYEYYRVEAWGEEPIDEESRDLIWYGMGWRQGEPSTCGDRPTA